ncbi:hypothetical protein BU26DRAFT_68463 [Trematosphaeria pertusa]|uniref:Uncharacterized protein n=1 Tax=Trematosphaeria pertusa TaxID=390896 RepID=A0A6A6I660_9PLEO|nr:uncharacterized protein BU26DRAFT_68463 [Trematosphaeria pertusa]KAF2245432.1 hypothetical protein BU26DRAFT_68463 [Trematosphaeria pertusa]
MSLLTSPLYLLGPPLLLLVSVPLAVFAFLTTTLAVSLLAVRVSVVYVELGVALLHAYLFPEPPKPLPKRPPPPPSSPPRFRNRHGSAASSASSQDTAVPAARLHNKAGSFANLYDTSMTRDFEGVGGWREPGDDDEEALWMGMNSRLELPAALPTRHQRRHTGESQRWSWSPEALRMSPMQSRSRTPTQTAQTAPSGGDYFPPQPAVRPLSTASELAKSAHRRKTSVGGSSSSSVGSSSRQTTIAIKEAGE